MENNGQHDPMKGIQQLQMLQQQAELNRSQRTFSIKTTNNKFRKIIVIVMWLVALVISMILLFEPSSYNFFERFITALLVAPIPGAFIVGTMHTSKLRQKTKGLLFIIFFGWIAWAIINIGAIMYGGMAFMYIDLVKLILKRPLYFKWELE